MTNVWHCLGLIHDRSQGRARGARPACRAACLAPRLRSTPLGFYYGGLGWPGVWGWWWWGVRPFQVFSPPDNTLCLNFELVLCGERPLGSYSTFGAGLVRFLPCTLSSSSSSSSSHPFSSLSVTEAVRSSLPSLMLRLNTITVVISYPNFDTSPSPPPQSLSSSLSAFSVFIFFTLHAFQLLPTLDHDSDYFPHPFLCTYTCLL